MKRNLEAEKTNVRLEKERFLRNHRKSARVIHKHQLKQKQLQREADQKQKSTIKKLVKSSSQPVIQPFDVQKIK